MRYYLDTNILAFLMTDSISQLSQDVRGIFEDYASILYTSTVCVQELIHLYQIGKIESNRRSIQEGAANVVDWLHGAGIGINQVTETNLKAFAALPLHGDHRDPNDRLIIAQAISDRIPLVSSDRKFERYRRYGLEFTLNER